MLNNLALFVAPLYKCGIIEDSIATFVKELSNFHIKR